MMVARLFPGVPFWAANYCASFSRMGYFPFLLATGLGSIPNTAAYVVAACPRLDPDIPRLPDRHGLHRPPGADWSDHRLAQASPFQLKKVVSQWVGETNPLPRLAA